MHKEPGSPEAITPEFDFSHLMRTHAADVAAWLRRHRKASDEMYLGALRQLDPLLELPEEKLAMLYRELSPNQSRRGRPRKNAPSMADIADALMAISRDDVPGLFLLRLSQRLRRRRPFRELERATPLYWHIRKRERMMHLRGLYRDFYMLLGDAGAQVHHPILGSCSVPGSGSRHEKALGLAQDAMRTVGLHPPSLDTIRNLTGKNSRAKT